MLGTTREFLDYFGLRSIDELPPLAELKAMADLNPQLMLPVAGDLEATEATETADGGDAVETPAPVSEPAPSDDEPVYVADRPEA